MTDAVLTRVEARLKTLPVGLQEHIQRTRALAKDFATALNVDPVQADLATAAHDLARAYDDAKQLAEAKRLGIVPNSVELETPLLLHGPIAAEYLRQDMNCTDKAVLEAVRWHTTAREGFGLVGQVVFLADKVDPQKVTRRPFLERVRELARINPSAAIAYYLGEEIQRQLQDGLMLHPAAVEARNYFLLQSSSR